MMTSSEFRPRLRAELIGCELPVFAGSRDTLVPLGPTLPEAR